MENENTTLRTVSHNPKSPKRPSAEGKHRRRPRQRGNQKSAHVNKKENQDVQLSKSLSWVLRHAAPSLGLSLSAEGYIPVRAVLELDHPRFRLPASAPQRENDGRQQQCTMTLDVDGPQVRAKGRCRYTAEDVARVVENNEKQRFRLEYKQISGELELCIRANQGHSIRNVQSDQLLTPLSPEQLADPQLLIIHGTNRKAWEDHIRSEGLDRRKRNHIHFATGLPSSFPNPTAVHSSAIDPGRSSNAAHNSTTARNDKTDAPISGIRSTSDTLIYVNGARCARDSIPFFKSDNGVILTAGVKEQGILPIKYFDRVVDAPSGQILWEYSDA